MRKRPIKPSTKIRKLQRDKRVLKAWIEWAAKEFDRIATAQDAGFAISNASKGAATELRRTLEHTP